MRDGNHVGFAVSHSREEALCDDGHERDSVCFALVFVFSDEEKRVAEVTEY